MSIKTYRGKTIAEALSQVKKDLGREAVILHTRTYKTGGVLGIGAHTMTEITATTSLAMSGTGMPEPRARSRPRVLPPPEPATEPLPESRPVRIPDPVPARPETSVAGALQNELASIKRLVGQVLQSARGTRHVGMPDALFDCYMRLVQSEVASEIADEVVGAVRDELRPAEMASPEVVRQAVLRRLAAYIPVVASGVSVPGRAPDGRPRTVALVGPTGVGKTTTAAKLAATYKLRQGKRVGLVTSDTYRIAAVEQLRTYANIIGLPLRVAMTPNEMRHACESLSDCDVILVDTAGRSPHDDVRLDELRRFVACAEPHETHLVLAGNAGESALRAAVERFAPIGPNHVIFTKLDEAVSFGVLVNIARRIEVSLSFVTTGQEVPDQIEAGDADRLARLVLDGMPTTASSSAEGGSV